MLEFDYVLIFTGSENRVSKDGKSYIIANYLNPSGHTFSTVVDCDLPKGLVQLDKVKLRLGLSTGRYTQLKTLSIVKM